MNTIERLESWNEKSKSHRVRISIDNGYGANCWEIDLWNGKNIIACIETMLMKPGDDWPGLEAVINAALDAAEEKWGRG